MVQLFMFRLVKADSQSIGAQYGITVGKWIYASSVVDVIKLFLEEIWKI